MFVQDNSNQLNLLIIVKKNYVICYPRMYQANYEYNFLEGVFEKWSLVRKRNIISTRVNMNVGQMNQVHSTNKRAFIYKRIVTLRLNDRRDCFMLKPIRF